MNKFISIFLYMHIGVIVVLMINIIGQYLLYRNYKNHFKVNPSQSLMSEISRTRMFLMRSIATCFMGTAFELIGFWLLWLGNAFDK